MSTPQKPWEGSAAWCATRMIRHARQEKDMTQAQLGAVLNVSHAMVSDIERGRIRITVDLLQRVAGVLEVEFSYTFGGRSYPGSSRS